MAADDPTQRDGLRLMLRALIGGVVITLSTAAAVTAAVLLEVEDTKDRFFANAPPAIEIPKPDVPPPDPGGPRTFLLLGSDERHGDRELEIKPRSDTMLLLRADPDKKVITVTSVPRDLRMPVPGHAPRTGKINEAYELRGPAGVVRALKALFEYAGAEPLKINHVLNVNFGGFRRAVDYLGGVYVDVDRRYFNDVPGVYATIDVKPGYQRLRGQDALDYVRYRHNDDDFIRAARQQDFLRQVKSQPSVRRLLRVQDRDRLSDVFGRYVQVDRSFRSTKTLLGLLKLGAFMDGSVIQTVRFRATANEDGSYVDATPDQLRETLHRLLHPKARAAARPRAPRRSEKVADYLDGLQRLQRPKAPRMALPFYAPSHVVAGSRLTETRRYRIVTLKDRRYAAYRIVFGTGRNGEYFGVQGTAWRTPPILVRPDRIRKVRGRRLLTFRDGARLRLVGWRTDRGAYWVSNTLNRALSNREMLGIAASLRRITG